MSQPLICPAACIRGMATYETYDHGDAGPSQYTASCRECGGRGYLLCALCDAPATVRNEHGVWCAAHAEDDASPERVLPADVLARALDDVMPHLLSVANVIHRVRRMNLTADGSLRMVSWCDNIGHLHEDGRVVPASFEHHAKDWNCPDCRERSGSREEPR